jgi:hypothetical protein
MMRTSFTLRMKDRSHRLANRAKQNGELIAPDGCESCGKFVKREMHHPDYLKPLDVIWLCTPCHRRVDRKGRKTSGKRQMINVPVDTAGWQEVRKLAIDQKRTAADVLNDAIDLYLKQVGK